MPSTLRGLPTAGASAYSQGNVKSDRWNLPVVGDRMPHQGNRVTRALGRGGLRLLGWQVTGSIPNREKLLVVVAPHTTGWDFVIAMITLLALGLRASWLGVDWLLRYPLMSKIGGIPVDRSAGHGVVMRAAREFGRRRQYILGISPEGSRKKVVPWKTGFYRIATGAGVPMLLGFIDQQRKLIHFGPIFEASGDYDADMERVVRPYYAPFLERYSDRFGM